MSERTVTYPAEQVQEIADLFCDFDRTMPYDEAMRAARDIVIGVTMAVDKLRAKEAEGA
jgi:hypothetical protein